MIRKLAVILLFSVVPLHNINAEPVWANKPMQCATLDEVIKLTKILEEEPFIYFEGLSTRPEGNFLTKFLITLNRKTNGWTLIEIPDEDQACILGAGQGEIKFNNGGITT